MSLFLVENIQTGAATDLVTSLVDTITADRAKAIPPEDQPLLNIPDMIPPNNGGGGTAPAALS